MVFEIWFLFKFDNCRPIEKQHYVHFLKKNELLVWVDAEKVFVSQEKKKKFKQVKIEEVFLY